MLSCEPLIPTTIIPKATPRRAPTDPGKCVVSHNSSIDDGIK
jgi:hypothetical protein